MVLLIVSKPLAFFKSWWLSKLNTSRNPFACLLQVSKAHSITQSKQMPFWNCRAWAVQAAALTAQSSYKAWHQGDEHKHCFSTNAAIVNTCKESKKHCQPRWVTRYLFHLFSKKTLPIVWNRDAKALSYFKQPWPCLASNGTCVCRRSFAKSSGQVITWKLLWLHSWLRNWQIEEMPTLGWWLTLAIDITSVFWNCKCLSRCQGPCWCSSSSRSWWCQCQSWGQVLLRRTFGMRCWQLFAESTARKANVLQTRIFNQIELRIFY